jgi:hypothetical protein
MMSNLSNVAVRVNSDLPGTIDTSIVDELDEVASRGRCNCA